MEQGDQPWARGDLSIDAEVLARVDDEARGGSARDEESCGVLIGPAGAPLRVDGILPMENRANRLHELDPEMYPRTGRMYFDIDTRAFEKKLREQADRGQPVKVLYHSHLDVGAYFSATDAAAATFGGDAPPHALAYLVTSVRGSRPGDPAAVVDDHKLFVWDPATRSFIESRFSVAVRGT